MSALADARLGGAVDVAIVLGCKPSPMLASRCARAVRLVREGEARRLFLTGRKDEIDAMRALVHVVDHDDILVDDAAVRTFDNVKHAKAVVGVAACVVVTSRFHLPRAMFLARRVGLNARGVADDGPPAALSTVLREGVSWLGAIVDALRA